MKKVLDRGLLCVCCIIPAIFSAGCAGQKVVEKDEYIPLYKELSKGEGASWDFTDLRIPGRETVTIAPGVVLHADHEALFEVGPTILTGRVYLDGSSLENKNRMWPRHAYADKALWKPEYGTLVLRGHLILERESSAVVANFPSVELVMDGKKKFKIGGLTHCDLPP